MSAMGNGSKNHDGNGHAPTASLTTTPFPASRKVYVDGTRNVRVPMREISLTPTRASNGGAPTSNPSVTVYDTSGPYTDPAVAIDVRQGLAPLDPLSLSYETRAEILREEGLGIK